MPLTPLLTLTFGLGILIGYFLYKFFIGGWTNREVDGFVFWIVNHETPKELKTFSLAEIVELYQEDSKIAHRLHQIKKKDERSKRPGLFGGNKDRR